MEQNFIMFLSGLFAGTSVSVSVLENILATGKSAVLPGLVLLLVLHPMINYEVGIVA